MSVIIDEATGLHAEDCPCVPCQTGYGPSPRERELARRAAADAKLRAEKAAAKGAKPEARQGWVSRYMPRVPDHRPYTAEELAELDRLRKDFRR